MQLSHYLKIWPYEESQGHFLCYSTRKVSSVLLNKDILDSIEKDSLSPSDAETLQRLGIIVTDVAGEKEAMHAFLQTLNEKNSCLNITVVMNLDCNFDCTYCYEGDMKGKLYMTEETAELLVRFVQSRFTGKMKSVNIDFYGGEPLLSRKLIISISQALKSYAESRGATYTFTLVTNGSLFTRRTAKELSQLGLQSIKTTLDGPPEIHDRCRPFKSGTGSFRSIIENIKETCDIVKIGIGGNYQQDNYEQFPGLFDYLDREGLEPERIAVIKFDPVMSRRDGEARPAEYVEGCMSVNEPWLMTASAFLREEILMRGYFTPKFLPLPCQVEVNDYFIVHFDGTIYKCPAFIGKKEFVIGDLGSGINDYSTSHRLGIWKNSECMECGYLPLCYGGCRYLAYVRDGNIDKVDCKRPYLDSTLETMIKQDARYRRPASARKH
jgi:uncharacterized protein